MSLWVAAGEKLRVGLGDADSLCWKALFLPVLSMPCSCGGGFRRGSLRTLSDGEDEPWETGTDASIRLLGKGGKSGGREDGGRAVRCMLMFVENVSQLRTNVCGITGRSNEKWACFVMMKT